jgi:hypothetical protein
MMLETPNGHINVGQPTQWPNGIFVADLRHLKNCQLMHQIDRLRLPFLPSVIHESTRLKSMVSEQGYGRT